MLFRSLRRQQELFEAGVVARKDLEQSQADVARAEAEFARANSRVRLYSSFNGVDQGLTLASGIHGVVVERNINPGQELRADLGGPGTPPLFVITDPQQLWAQIDAREIDLHSLKPGQDILIKVPTLPEAFFKAQIHAGGRGKGKIQGSEQKGVAVGKSAEEIKTIAGNILGGTLVTLQTGPAGKVVNKILVAQDVYYSGSTPTREFYLSILLDRSKGQNVIMYSTEGGVNIEDVAHSTPEKIFKEWVHPSGGLQPFQARKIAFNLQLSGEAFKNCVRFVTQLYQAYVGLDCSMLEINPLFKTSDEKIIAVPSDKVSPTYRKITNYSDLPDMLLQRISHFFSHYKDLEANKWVKIDRWGDEGEAKRLIENGIAALTK